MYRFKTSIPVGYDKQGFIYFWSKRYRKLHEEERDIIKRACREAGGPYAAAVREFVTGDHGAGYICSKHYLSESTLERAVRKYYVTVAKYL